jgi:lipoprotein-anchoring transpeptidase ErfK/SrfK
LEISVETITHARIDLPLCAGRQSGMITRGSVDSETAKLDCWPLRKPSRYTFDMNKGVSVSVAIAIIVMLSSPSKNVQAFPVQKRTAAARKPAARRITREMIVEAQQRLAALGYWIGDSDGKWGDASRHGLIAFQKVEGRRRTGRLTPAELIALNAASRPNAHERGAAHVEVDLTRQVLFVVDDAGTVSHILPVSTGSGKLFTVDDYTQPAITPVGRFRVFRKLDGWRKSKLGLLYFPSYIVGGIAIHGNPSVPVQAASHGCIRIPMFASEEFSDMSPIGTPVIVYGTGPAAQANPQP